ncbi:MAG: hypothetical protein PQJ61_14230 [Spirochaetales bacterium]|uniref:Uncharacterized protein n=1 Tax=Candidatus Thalassospirochaeta sargassi TaxID=3119039 RepID=A0AAJ1IEL8_9SPIO|nr:hypothetical protein [Spirochaetales bacterium]
MSEGLEDFAYTLGDDLVLTDFVKTILIEHGLTVEQVKNLQTILVPEIFTFTENDKFIDEDAFYELQEVDIGRWIDTFKEQDTTYEGFFAHQE